MGIFMLLAWNSQSATITSTGTGGNWSNPATWVGGIVPAAGDDVVIADGATVTIDTDPATLNSLVVGQGTSGVLNYDATTRTVTVNGIVTIKPGAQFRSAAIGSTSTVTNHSLIIGGSLINDGTINFSAPAGAGGTTANASGTGITFTGASNAVFNCGGAALTNLRNSNGVILNKGTSASSVLTFSPGGTFQVLSGNTDGFLSITNGTFKIIGANSFSNPVFNIASYSIPTTGGFELSNSNATVVGQNGSVDNNGILRISAGVYNIGTMLGNSSVTNNNGSFELSGGEMNVAGRFLLSNATGTFTGGNLNISTIGHSSSTQASFECSITSDLVISGSTVITLIKPNSSATPSNDIEIFAGGSKSITGGTIQLGNVSTPAGSVFRINSDIPLYNLSIASGVQASLVDDLAVNHDLNISGELQVNSKILSLKKSSPEVVVNFSGGTFGVGAAVNVTSTAGKHPNNASAINYLNHYWSISTTGITNPVYDVTINYLQADVNGTESKIITGGYTSGLPWVKYTLANTTANTLSATGVTSTNLSITGISNDPPTVVIDNGATATICSGSSLVLNTTATGDPTLTFSWVSNPAGFISNLEDPSISPLVNTDYTVTVTDGNGYSATDMISVTVNPSPSSSNGTATTCSSIALNYDLQTRITNGLASNFTWTVVDNPNVSGESNGSGDFITQTLTNVSNAAQSVIYTVTPTSETNSCVGATFTVTVTVNPQPVGTNGTTTTCSAVALNYNLQSQISNSVASNFTWTVVDNPNVSGESNGSGDFINQTLTNVSNAVQSVIYTVTPTSEANSCAGATFTVTVTVNPQPVGTNGTTTTCSAVALNYNLQSQISNSVASNFTWTVVDNPNVSGESNGSGDFITQTLTNVSNAAQTVIYTVTPTSETNSCAGATFTVTVTVNPQPVGTNGTTTTCSAVALNYNLQSQISNSVTSNFTWTVVDNPNVSGESNGSGDFITQTLTNTSTATQTVTYTITPTSEANSCAGATFPVTVTVYPTPNATATPASQTICSGSNISIALSSLVAGTTFSWTISDSPVGSITGASAGSGNNINQTLTNTNPLQATITYSVTPRANGCDGTPVNVVITVNPKPTLSSSLTPAQICSNTVFNYTPTSDTPGTTFAWSRATILGITPVGTTGTGNPNETLTNITGAIINVTYVFTLTANGCTNTQNVVVPVLPALTLNSSLSPPAVCSTTAPFVYNPTSAIPGVTITWSRAVIAGISNPAASGTGNINETLINTTTNSIVVPYVFTLSAGTCTNTQTVNVTVRPLPELTSTLNPSAICNNTAFIYTATSNVVLSSIQWSRAVVAGISNPAGFGATTSINETLVNTTANPINVTYAFTLRALGCQNVQNVVVTVNPTPKLSSTQTPPAICSNSVFSYTPTSLTAGTTFSWTRALVAGISNAASSGTDNPNETLINTTASPVSVTYVYTLTANGCSNTQNVVVVVNPLPTITATTSNATICEGASATLTASGASTYTWSPATGLSSTSGATVTASPTTTTTYTVTGTDANGCSNTATVTVNVLPRPTVTVTSSNGSICTTGSSTLTASGAATYTWSPATGLSATTGAVVTANPATTTTYTVTGTAANGCTNTATITVSVYMPFTVTATASPATICEGNSSTLTANGAVSYVWSPADDLSSPTGSSVTATPSTTTTYTVVGTDANGCTNSTTVTVTVNPMPVLTNPNPIPATLCSGVAFNYSPVSSVSGTTFSWTRNTPAGITSSSPTSGTGNISNHILTNTTASPIPVTYTYTLSASGCTNPITYDVIIVVIPAPTVNVFANGSTSLTICEGTNVNLTSNSSLISSPPVLLSENFNSAATGATTGPNGWTTTNGSTGGNPNNARWTVRQSGYVYDGDTYRSNDNSQFYFTNSQAQGGGNTLTTLVSPSFSTIGYTTLQLDFWQYYNDRGAGQGDYAYVDVSTNVSFSTYTTVLTLNGDYGNRNPFDNHQTGISLNAYINNPAVYIRFRYVATNDRYWGIDNVTVTGTSANNPVISWTSNPAGFTSNVANPPAAVSPTVTTTYTVTYTDPTADPNTLCPGSASVTVTVRPEPTMTSTNTLTICSGDNVNLALTSDVPSTYSWVATSNGSVTGESTTAQTGSTISDILTNTTSGPVNVIYTVTPTATTGSCVGAPQTVTVRVNPTPTVNPVVSRAAVCSGTPAAAINFGSNVAGATFDWTSTADVGFGTSGAGNTIPAYTATNTTDTPVTATVSVTATANGCTGPVRTFTVAVNPVPVATIEANYCPAAPNQNKIELTAETGAGTYTYLWSTGQTTKTIYVDIADNYSVVVTNSYGCSTSAFLPVSNDLVVNGSFTNGNASFVSTYTYKPDLPGLVPAGQGELYNDTGSNGYSIVTNGQNVHVNFWGIDHTNNSTGNRNFLIVNGHGSTLTIWQQTVNIQPNTNYYFSAWAMSVNAVGPYARLQFEVNGTPVGSIANLTAGPNSIAQANANNYWTRFYSTPYWNSGSLSGPINIRIINLESALNGNDFALDDISFGTLDPAPGTITPTVNGLVCQYGNLNLLANKTSTKPPFTYSWTGPNGWTSTDENPVITNISSANSGRYNLSFTDGYGCSTLTGFVDVTVNATPVCSITGTTTTIPNATNTFTAPAGMATYAWIVTGNGSIVGSSTGQSVNVQAGATCTGSYTVSVTITESSGCSSNCSQIVNLNDNAAPVVSGAFTLQTINGCVVADAPAATTVAQLEALPGGVTITDAFTPKALLTVTHSDVVSGTCPIAIIRTYTVTDACGNFVTLTQNINIQDSTAPVITGTLSAATVQGCSAADAPAAVTTVAALEALAGAVTINDACTPKASLTVTSSDVASGTCNITVTRTYTIKDACNNSVNLVQTINIQDSTAPTWTTLANALNVTVQCGDAPGLAAAQAMAPAATDACTTLQPLVKTFGAFVAGGTCPQIGTYTNTWTVQDVCGNTSAVFTQVITIQDTTPPDWTTPPGSLNVFLECSDAAGIAAAQAMVPVATDNCGGSYVPVKTSGTFVPSGSCPQAGTYTNTFVVTDICGNASAPFVQIITLEDNTAPDIIAPTVAVISCLDNPNNLALTGSPTATDNCDAAPIITHSDVSVPTTCGGDYKIVRTWTATDHCGNSNSATQEIFVQDIEAPVISALPAPFTIDCDDTPNFTTPTAIDACASTFTLTSADTTTPGTCANSYSIIRTWTAKDACGNTSTATQTINVQDVVAPVITCPAAVNGVAGSAECGATGLALGTPTVTDNCTPLAQIVLTNNAPALFPIGVTTVTWTATDACGNSSTCTQTVTITDNNLPPTISCPANVSETAAANNCSKTNVVIGTPTYSDNCPNPVLTYTLTGATTGSGAGIVPVAQVYNVGVTTVTYTVTDSSNNTASCSFTVTIISVSTPNISIGGCTNVSETAAANNCSKIPTTIINPTYSDNCWPLASLTLTWTMTGATTGSGSGSVVGQTFNTGVTTVTYTVTNPDGLTASCSFTVTIVSVNTPNISIGGCTNVSETAAANNCSKTPTTIVNPTYSDACWPLASLTLSWTMTGATTGSGTGSVVGQTFNTGVTTVTYTVTNPDGLSATCSFTVTILALTPPSFTSGCPSDITQSADAGMCNANITVPVPAVSDPCNLGYTVINSFNSTNNASGIYPIGTTSVTWTITPTVGAVTTCVQTITVNDLLPTLSCPANITVNADFNQTYASNVAVPLPTYSDNCPGLTLVWTMSGVTTGNSPATGINTVPSPNTFNVGVTTISYTLTDANSHVVTCSFTVTVEAKPVITCPADITRNTDPGVCTATLNPGFPTKVSGVEPITYSWVMTGATTGSGTGSIGNYTFNKGTTIITWTATNISGTDQCTQNIIVIDNESPVITICPVSRNLTGCDTGAITGPAFSAISATSSYAVFSDATNQGVATDNCGIVTVNYIDVASGTCPIVVTRTWTVLDAAGLQASCNQTITIQRTDFSPPAAGSSTVACPANAVDPGAPASILDACGRTITPVLVGSVSTPAT
ncbi:MAG: HYR domain-containing protein, partial [Prolixibacteraceae bacterium]|nr:HYR domain-containing protein [Prolixibacteraceae bacterium]